MTITASDFTTGQMTFITRLAADTNLDPRVVAAWVISEESGDAAKARQATGNNDWLNIGYTDSATFGSSDSVWSNPATAANATAGWLQGNNTIPGYGKGSSGVQAILQSAGRPAATQIRTIQRSGWASSGYPALASTYADIASDFTGSLSTTLAGGGIFGLGGTGTAANAATSLWVVGSSDNPDQDYWTTINQYGQDAQWYVFSDGETLYVADGIRIMGQEPEDVVLRTDPRVMSVSLTYDNTTFQNTHTHLIRSSNAVLRRAVLAKTQSPTQCEIKIICGEFQYRAGSTIYLSQFGAADGIWLIGEAQRGMFDPFSTLTLVQAQVPINAQSGNQLGPAYQTGKQDSKPGSGKVIAALISEAATINNKKIPYEYGGGHGAIGTPSVGSTIGNHEGGYGTVGFDCSGGVATVLAAGGLLELGSPLGSDEDIIARLKAKGLILPGSGSGRPECTIYDNPGDHIFMRLNGQYWGTSDGGGTPTANGGGGGMWITNGPDTSTFDTYHIPKRILGQSATTVTTG